MENTNTVNIFSSSKQNIRLYVNRELFIDQTLPFVKNRLHLTYNSDHQKNKIRIKTSTAVYSFEVSSNDTIDVDLNK